MGFIKFFFKLMIFWPLKIFFKFLLFLAGISMGWIDDIN